MGNKTSKRFQIFIWGMVLIFVFATVWFFYKRVIQSGEIRNVVLISIDTCRADYLSCYGYSLKTTPNIDDMAGDGIVFENAITPVPSTLPGHSTMLTGTGPLYHGVHDNYDYALSRSNLTLAEILRDNGFATAAVISSFVLDHRFGLDQGFENYDDCFDEGLSSMGITERRGEEVSRHANLWIEKNKNEKFFLFIHYYDPHFVWDPPEPFKSSYVDNPYAGEIAYDDYCIGQVLDKLKSLGLYDSSLIIITSDHGESLGEHEEQTHGYFIYQSTLRVPLIFKLPGKNKGVRIIAPAGLADVVPTVCSLLGMVTPQQVEGKDLFAGDSRYKAVKRDFYIESLLPTTYKCNSLLGIVSDNFKYIQTSEPELYDLGKDPAESNNIISRQPQRVRIMQDKLKQILEKQVRKNVDSKTKLDIESKARLESLGYVGGCKPQEPFEFDQNKPDAKDFVEFHALNSQAVVYLSQKMYPELQEVCSKMLQLDPNFAKTYRYLGDMAYKQGDDEKAVCYFSKYIKLDPANSGVFNNLGLVFSRMGRIDEAIENFRLALAINPDSVETLYNLAYRLAGKGRLEEAIGCYRKALEINPDDADVKRELGLELAKQEKLDKGIEYFSRIINDNPNSAKAANAYYQLAEIYRQLDKPEQAMTHYEKALQNKSDYIKARSGLAYVLLEKGKKTLAAEQFYLILQTEPNHVETLNALAWILATTEDEKIRNAADAVKFAEKACELTDYKMPELLDTLAAGYAATGRFNKAIQTAEKAIQLSDSGGKKELSANIRSRLELYKTAEPYREPSAGQKR